MGRLIVVSNRLPANGPSSPDSERSRPAGGLAAALRGALRRSRGSIWFGWSGRSAPERRLQRLSRQRMENVDLVGLPLSRADVADYYHGFCNDGLWPLLHSFQGMTRFEPEYLAAYVRVNRRFAQTIIQFLSPGDCVWVQDYHFLLLGRELRRLGWGGRLGFFLHIPFPPRDLWEILPDSLGFLSALLDYDLVGFHTEGYLDNYLNCARRLLNATWDGSILAAGPRRQRAGAYPIGIDQRIFSPRLGEKAVLRDGVDLTAVVRGRRLILGVDRLDYTKGIPERILALETLFRAYPAWRKRVSFVQIAAPSRERIRSYADQKRKVEALVGRINGEMAEHDWVPIRYLYRSYPPETLATFYRQADVMLVTPLRDGMNLVAKEFIAVQDPDSPGVLVLSRFAGAAEDLPEALLVNPYVPSETARGIADALEMPLAERRARHRRMLKRVMSQTAAIWADRFTSDLRRTAQRRG